MLSRRAFLGRSLSIAGAAAGLPALLRAEPGGPVSFVDQQLSRVSRLDAFLSAFGDERSYASRCEKFFRNGMELRDYVANVRREFTSGVTPREDHIYAPPDIRAIAVEQDAKLWLMRRAVEMLDHEFLSLAWSPVPLPPLPASVIAEYREILMDLNHAPDDIRYGADSSESYEFSGMVRKRMQMRLAGGAPADDAALYYTAPRDDAATLRMPPLELLDYGRAVWRSHHNRTAWTQAAHQELVEHSQAEREEVSVDGELTSGESIFVQRAHGTLLLLQSQLRRFREIAVTASSGTCSPPDGRNLQVEVSGIVHSVDATLRLSRFAGRPLFPEDRSTVVRAGPREYRFDPITTPTLRLRHPVDTGLILSVSTPEFGREALGVLDAALEIVAANRRRLLAALPELSQDTERR